MKAVVIGALVALSIIVFSAMATIEMVMAGGGFSCNGDMVAVERVQGFKGSPTVVNWKWEFACFKG